MKVLVLALVLSISPVVAVDPPEIMVTGVSPEFYMDVVSVGCVPSVNGQIAYVWHQQVSGLEDAKVLQVFKHLQSPRFEGCLSAIARTRAGLYQALLDLEPDTYPDTMRAVRGRAHRVWEEYGADLAIQEVAETGAQGPETRAFFDRCDALLAGGDRNKL